MSTAKNHISTSSDSKNLEVTSSFYSTVSTPKKNGGIEDLTTTRFEIPNTTDELKSTIKRITNANKKLTNAPNIVQEISSGTNNEIVIGASIAGSVFILTGIIFFICYGIKKCNSWTKKAKVDCKSQTENRRDNVSQIEEGYSCSKEGKGQEHPVIPGSFTPTSLQQVSGPFNSQPRS